MTDPMKPNFKRAALTALIISGAIFALSGLCAGLFIMEDFSGNKSDYSPGAFGALIIGSFGLIPSGLGLWAALRHYKRGVNTVSSVLFLILGGLMALAIFWPLMAIVDITGSGRFDLGVLLIVLIPTLICIAGVFLIINAVKMLGAPKP